MHRCLRYALVAGALMLGFQAWGQGPELPVAVAADPLLQLLAWALQNFGITGVIALGAGYLLGKKGGIPVRLSDEDRELLKK